MHREAQISDVIDKASCYVSNRLATCIIVMGKGAARVSKFGRAQSAGPLTAVIEYFNIPSN